MVTVTGQEALPRTLFGTFGTLLAVLGFLRSTTAGQELAHARTRHELGSFTSMHSLHTGCTCTAK